MKKRVSIIFAALILVISLSACGGNKKDTSFTGLYTGSTVNILGDDTPINEIYSNGENSVLLNEDKTGVMTVDGESLNITYVLDGQNIEITSVDAGDDMICVGTLADGVLSFDFFGIGIQMKFVK